MKKSLFLSLPLSIFITVSAMAAETPVVPAAAEKPAAPAAAAPETAAPAAAAPAKKSGHTAGMMQALGGDDAAGDAKVNVSGKVIQTMNAGGYSYILVEKADGVRQWVAVAEQPVKVGADMTFLPGANMGKFESRALKRTFDSIIFSDGVVAGAEKGAVVDPGKGQGVSPGSQGAATSTAKKISVPKATGSNAVTVEEAYKNSAKLNKKKITVRGQVVKVSVGIMNKTWIHIQDGTGSEKKKTHNLVCTSADDTADVGDVVTITGTLIKDKDFGAGYKYNVIIEDAKVSK